ncbi:MAG: DUF3126 family protein [Rhodomicrobium sp.]
MTPAEIKSLESYFRKRFGHNAIEVRRRGKIKDSAEVYVDEEFAGVISRDDEDNEVSYQFHMTILEDDLKS